MERNIALIWVLGAVILVLLVLGMMDGQPEPRATQATPQVVINDPDAVVVSDRAMVSDTVQTIAPGQRPITQVYPRECAGTCATACPMAAVTSGYCPQGYLCCS